MATFTQDQIKARLRIVDEHLRAENDHDVDSIMKTFVETPTFVLNGEIVQGQENIRAFYEGFGFGGAGGFSNIRVEERRRHVNAETIIVEATLTAEHTDTWQGIPATERRIEVPLCAIFPFDADGRLTGETVYMDGALLLKQLGVLS